MHAWRDAVRLLTRAPRFAASSVAILTVGLGASVAVFAVVRAVLLQPLPYHDPGRLVRLWESNPSKGIRRSRVSRGNFADWRRDLTSFEAVEAFYPPAEDVGTFDHEPEVVRTATVTRGFMKMLGVAPLIGDANAPGMTLSYGYWQRRFGGDPNVTSRTLRVGNTAIPINGVMPRGFDFPAGADAWETMSFGTERGARNLNVLARVRPHTSIEQARAELDALGGELTRRYPAENSGWRPELEPLQDVLVAPVRPMLWLLYATVTLMAALAIVNVALIFVVRASARSRHMAIRIALGASRSSIRLHAGIESLLIGGLATVAGTAGAWLVLRILVASAPAALPRLTEISLTAEDIAAAAGMLLVTTLALTIAAGANRRVSIEQLRVHQPLRGRRFRAVLVIVEVAACACILTIATHTVRRFAGIAGRSTGFEAHHVLAVRVQQPLFKTGEHVKHYPTRRFAAVAERVAATARTLPGVDAAGVGMTTPLAMRTAITSYRVSDVPRTGPIRGMPPVAGPDAQHARLCIVDPGYFRALAIPILTGRSFAASDRLDDRQIDDFDADRGIGAAIVSARFAHQVWPDSSALGRYLEVDQASYRSVEVVGVAGDVAESRGEDGSPTIYLPFAQTPMDHFTLFVRTSGEPAAVVAPLRSALRQFGTDVMTVDARSMDDIATAALAAPRFTARVLESFGAVAIALTAAALYAVLTLVVALHQRDFAVHMAIGASPRRLFASVVFRGMALTTTGAILGIVFSAVATRGLQQMTADLRADSLSSAVLVPALLLVIGALASIVPGWRAMRVDPITLLRSE